MIKNFTQNIKMACGLFLGLACSLLTTAQVTHQVTVQNTSFTPANIEINVGDIVEWINVGGTHNVNGTIADNPDNTESFGNGVAGNPWTYSYTFTMEGENSYICDAHPQMMQGTVTVLGSSEIPANDETCDAIAIACNQPLDASTIDATQSLGPTECSGELADGPVADVWFSFTADGEAFYNIQTSQGFDGIIGLYGGDCEDPELLTCVDLTVNAPETLNAGVLATGNYLIRVYEYESSDDFTITLSCTEGAQNDEACDAIEIACGQPLSTTSNFSTESLGAVECSGALSPGPVSDVWYTFDADGTSDYSIETSLGFDAVIALYSNDCGEPLYVDCIDFTVDEEPEVLETEVLEAGVYMIRIYGYDYTDDFSVTLSCNPTGISELSKENQVIQLMGETISVLNPEKVEQIAFYDITGQLVQENAATGDLKLLKSLSAGIYIAVAYDYSGTAIQSLKMFKK